MAELLLGRLGAAAGAALLPKGLAVLGETAGKLAGMALDAQFLTPPRQGPRIKSFHLIEGREGAGTPVVYGRCRVGGQLIWAARFREHREVQGGKGGPRIAEYSYTLSFAVALCEGEISRVSRCWANGEPFDLSQVTWRLYRGTEDQAPDPLIEAIEGADNAPAYAGTAYIVFEDMPVDAFGARMPQMSFEIVRAAAGGDGRLESVARAVNMIPGSGEFALSTDIVRRRIGPGQETPENLHGPERKSDFEASLDQLEAELPNVTRVNLVVAWFGDDLRCGECSIAPGVEIAAKTTAPHSWSVAGISRDAAHLVSSVDGRPSYGGTPSDESVRQAVAMLKARGYHVTLYPFLLMDIPAGNALPDPSGDGTQPAYPWRGRITATAGDVASQVDAFFDEYRPFILHYAALADEAGADGILIGSELRGLTRLKAGGVFPVVSELATLAADVRAIVGAGCEISYAADWTEYGALVSGDDVDFPLDALWANDAIDYVGLDWYPPMADWRDGGDHADAAFGDGRSRDYLGSNVAGGEAFDWYYADAAGRLTQDRVPITDGAYGEPWVFRQKDIASWWGNAHHPRAGGVRSDTPTDWAPGMKPVRFVEMGVPAVDKGANQPNVFYDPKSSESALPHFSSGRRDDLIQRRAVEAFHAHWADPDNNPFSTEYAGRMLPDDGIALWAWDARPFPAFPLRDDVWEDAGNWRLGHWLNGRTGLALLPDVVADVCARADVACDVTGLAGMVTGYAFEGPADARAVLEPLASAYGFVCTERDGALVFRMRDSETVSVSPGRLVEQDRGAIGITRMGLDAGLPSVRLRYVASEADHMPAVAWAETEAADEIVDVELPIAMDEDQARQCARQMSDELRLSRTAAQFAMAADGLVIEPGDIVTVDGSGWRITERADGIHTSFRAIRAGIAADPVLAPALPGDPPDVVWPVEPDIVIVDPPALPGQEDDARPLGFAYASPWPGRVVFGAGSAADQMTARGELARPCTMGRLIGALYPHVSGRWQEASIWVDVVGGAPASRTELAVLNGANTALVETEAGWELIQFRDAELVSEGQYRLDVILRGQQGSEAAMASGASAGARILFLTGAEQRLDVAGWERGLDLMWQAGARSSGVDPSWTATQSFNALALEEWSPAHLSGEWAGGDIQLSWIRRARKDGDPWLAGEPPLTAPERYVVRVSDSAGALREWEVAAPAATYGATDQAVDFPAGGDALVAVSQVGPNGLPGAWAAFQIVIPAP
ncbi:MAG: glycoside hydrolase/phage tail family protein [Hyphomonadaceae bacterium]